MLELDGYDSSEDAKSELAPSVGGDDLASAQDDDDGDGMDIDGVDQDCLIIWLFCCFICVFYV